MQLPQQDITNIFHFYRYHSSTTKYRDETVSPHRPPLSETSPNQLAARKPPGHVQRELMLLLNTPADSQTEEKEKGGNRDKRLPLSEPYNYKHQQELVYRLQPFQFTVIPYGVLCCCFFVYVLYVFLAKPVCFQPCCFLVLGCSQCVE